MHVADNLKLTLRAPSVPSPSSSVSKLGLGCVTFGREIDRVTAFAMMDHALARGIDFFDSAAAYGGGASETIVGEWLTDRGARERVSIATKLLPPYTPATVEAGLAASLARLRTPMVDVLFLHRWDSTAIDPDTLRALDRLVCDGRVRALGASNFDAAQLASALQLQAKLGITLFRVLQNVHNLAVHGIDAPIRQLCTRNEIEIVTYSPLGAGFLTGKHDAGVQPGSRFDLIPGHQNVYFNDLARQRLARLKRVASESGVPMTTLSLAWALRQPQIDTVLVGGRTTAQLDQAFAAREFADVKVLQALDDESD